MSHESESEAVAADFRDALDDLAGFARAEINNLTLIARENTEHALAISGALQEHIKRVSSRFLPSSPPLIVVHHTCFIYMSRCN